MLIYAGDDGAIMARRWLELGPGLYWIREGFAAPDAPVYKHLLRGLALVRLFPGGEISVGDHYYAPDAARHCSFVWSRSPAL